MTTARQQLAAAQRAAGSELEATLALQIKARGLPTPEREYLFAIGVGRRFRFDFAWEGRMVAAEVDGATFSGGRHTTGTGIERDAEKYSTAAAMGWRVLRFTKAMIEDGRAISLIERALS